MFSTMQYTLRLSGIYGHKQPCNKRHVNVVKAVVTWKHNTVVKYFASVPSFHSHVVYVQNIRKSKPFLTRWTRLPDGNLKTINIHDATCGIVLQVFLCCLRKGSDAASIPSKCCRFPFIVGGQVYHSCANGGCYNHHKQWVACEQPGGMFVFLLCQ